MVQKTMNTLNDINSIIITDSIPSWTLFSLCIFRLSIDLIVLELIVVETMVFLIGLAPAFLWVMVRRFGTTVIEVMSVVRSLLG